MNEVVNPRAAGFNYGVGWGPAPKPPVYLTAMAKCRELRKIANEASKAAWALEMACRNVRLAETAVDKTAAVQVLHAEMQKHIR